MSPVMPAPTTTTSNRDPVGTDTNFLRSLVATHSDGFLSSRLPTTQGYERAFLASSTRLPRSSSVPCSTDLRNLGNPLTLLPARGARRRT